MRPPITTIPGIPADWDAIGKSMRVADAPREAANDPVIKRTPIPAVQDWEDEGGSVLPLKPPPPKPPAERP